MGEKIEILECKLFEILKEEMKLVGLIREDLKKQIGWHYYLDLAWMLHEIRKLPQGALILDAGAGTGLTQFMLASLGYNVISADFATRAFPRRFWDRYGKMIYFLKRSPFL